MIMSFKSRLALAFGVNTVSQANVNRRVAILLAVFGGANAFGPRSEAAKAADRPFIKVARNAGCGCCLLWGKHLEANGFRLEMTERRDLAAYKAQLGVPEDLASCHTGIIDGYVIEGHVPADAIKRLLAAKPKAIGLAVPGMPSGSPGMEGGTPEVYEVVLFGKSERSSFGRWRGDRQIG